MDGTWLMAIMLFTLSMSLTPGPNNVMLIASGAQFGYKKSLPHITGVLIGVSGLFIAILLGLKVMFEQYPQINDYLKVVGSVYLFWLAWKIATASTVVNSEFHKSTDAQESKKISLFQASIFQLVNPKSWAVTIGSVSTFTLTGVDYIESGLWIMACFAVSGFIGMSLWTCFGVQMAKQLTTVKRKKYFNYTMGLLTVCTLFLILT